MPKGVPNKRYTPEFKKLVVETMMKEKMSYRETARQFEISNYHRVQDWERIYLTEGPEGFAIERRGRGSKSRPPKPLPKSFFLAVERWKKGELSGKQAAEACSMPVSSFYYRVKKQEKEKPL